MNKYELYFFLSSLFISLHTDFKSITVLGILNCTMRKCQTTVALEEVVL